MSELNGTPLGMFVSSFGSADFCRRISSILAATRKGLRSSMGSYAEAWSAILDHRPDMILLELGPHHNEKQQAWVRRFLEQIRERFERDVCVVLVLTSPDKLYFGGDLLFTEDKFEPSGLVDSFLVVPPSSVPSVPTLAEQVVNVVELLEGELQRRTRGKIPLPSLNSEGWAQSLADPKSRELWMKWLPRYASYTSENPIIVGKTGTGKTNLAYALHLLSERPGKFVTITPRDFSSSELVQAELFGAVAGAYTGAVDKWGLVKAAEKGTLFIDELQSIDKDLQGKLITFIENKVYRRVGSSETIAADVRFVFASNRSLYDMMEKDVLRDDFAYRLERVQLELLPLQLRRLDVAAALAYSLAKIRRQRPHALMVYGLTSGAYRMLFGHRWPGNLRQLENVTARLCELSDMNGVQLIDAKAVTQVFDSRLSGGATGTGEIIAQASEQLSRLATAGELRTLDEASKKLAEFVRSTALEVSGGDVSHAAAMIDDSPNLLNLVSENLTSQRQLQNIK